MSTPRTCAPALIVCFVLLLSCGDGRRDVRNFYFPVRELVQSGRVYVYEKTGTLPGPEQEYAYYLGVDQDTALYLSVTQYDGSFSPRQQTRQQIENDGVYLRDLLLLQTDSTGVSTRIPTQLLFRKAFPFYLDEATPEAVGYRLSFAAPDDATAVTYVSLNRRFRGDTTLNVLGSNYPAVVFDLAGEVSERDGELGDISPQFTGFEIYARGLGLVQYERELSPGATTGGRLIGQLTMPEFLEQIGR